MTENTRRMIITLGGIATLYFGYKAYQQSQAAAPPAPALPPGTPTTGVLPTTTQTAAGTAAPTSMPVTSGGAPNGIDPTVYATVMSWVNSDGRPPVMAFGAAQVPSEYAGMYDIIVNQWMANASPTPARTAFWNSLRNKYDPNHKYW
jgi:hypothetical protein